jgi:acetyl-CoA C-acetyltransferase
MSIAIAPAIQKLMKHHQLAVSDIDLWEVHESYAVTTLYNQAKLEILWPISSGRRFADASATLLPR